MFFLGEIYRLCVLCNIIWHIAAFLCLCLCSVCASLCICVFVSLISILLTTRQILKVVTPVCVFVCVCFCVYVCVCNFNCLWHSCQTDRSLHRDPGHSWHRLLSWLLCQLRNWSHLSELATSRQSLNCFRPPPVIRG